MAALDLLGRRWTLRIVWELHVQPAGFRDLQRRCDQMSSSVLNTRLTELADAGIVAADSDGYALTKQGHDLVKAMSPLETWSKKWAATLA